MSVKKLVEKFPFAAADDIKDRLKNFEDISGVVVLFRDTQCTLRGYDDEVIGENRYLDIHYSTEEIKDCFAPVNWFSEQISGVGDLLIEENISNVEKRRKDNVL